MSSKEKVRAAAGTFALFLVAGALLAAEFIPRRWDDPAVPDAATFDAGDKLMGLNGSAVTRFSRSVLDAVYALSSRTISTTAPLSGGGDLTANRTLSVSAATTSATGVVELATSGEVAAGLAVQANDARLSDARTPTAHASSHYPAGSDPLTADALLAEYSPWNQPESGDIGGSGACVDLFDGNGTCTWEWANQGTSTANEVNDALEFTATNTSASESIRCRVVTAPTVDYTVTALLTHRVMTAGNVQVRTGIGVIEGTVATPTKIWLLGNYSNNNADSIIPSLTSWTAYSGAGGAIEGTYPAGAFDSYREGTWFWQMRYEVSSNVATWVFSSVDNGRVFYSFGTDGAVHTETLASDPARVGFCINNNGNNSAGLTAEWFMVRTDGNRSLPGE